MARAGWIFMKLVFFFFENQTRTTGALHEKLCTFMTISCSFILKMKIVETKHTTLGGVRQASNDSIIQYMHFAY